MKTFREIKAQEILAFRIYPRASIPRGVAIEFARQDHLVQDFFLASQDARRYKPSHDTIDSKDDSWFLEMETEKSTIHINFYIPSGQKSFVVGIIRQVNKAKIHYYFQSKSLLQWYQEYSDHWLEPK
jgi:hypothetical protein